MKLEEKVDFLISQNDTLVCTIAAQTSTINLLSKRYLNLLERLEALEEDRLPF